MLFLMSWRVYYRTKVGTACFFPCHLKKLRSGSFCCTAVLTISLTQTVINKNYKISLQLLYDFSTEIGSTSLKLDLLSVCIYECKHSKTSEAKAHIIISKTWFSHIHKWCPWMMFQRIKEPKDLMLAFHSGETFTRKMHQVLYFQC